MSDTPGAKLHVTFNRSIAFTLRQALLLQGLSDPVVGFCDDLSFGPLDVTPQARADWIADVVGYDFDDVVVEAEAKRMMKAASMRLLTPESQTLR